MEFWYEEGVDKEWVELILTAKKMGITSDEIRNFLKQSNTMND